MIKAGLDFGNSKISCIVADYKNSTNIDILSLEWSHLRNNYMTQSDDLLKYYLVKNIFW